MAYKNKMSQTLCNKCNLFWLLGTENECSNKQCNIAHHSPIDDECQIQSAKNLALPDEQATENNSGDTP